MPDVPTNHCNKAVRSFGFDETRDMIVEFARNYQNRTLVSVGSGNGRLEAGLIAMGVNVVCIEPQWNDFGSEGLEAPFVEPAFRTVADYVIHNPEIVGNVVLLLNWCNPCESKYDLEAIEQLNPVAFWVIYEKWKAAYDRNEPSGAAGGQSFHVFLSETEAYENAHSVKLSYPPDVPPQLNILMEWWHRMDSSPVPSHTMPDTCVSSQLNPDSFERDVMMVTAILQIMRLIQTSVN